MTDTETDVVAVTQADIAFAATWASGALNADAFVQAVARHRLAALADQRDERGGVGLRALDRFVTDHEGSDETKDGQAVDADARQALRTIRRVMVTATALCDSGTDDCTGQRMVTVDPDAFDLLNAALDAALAASSAPDCGVGELIAALKSARRAIDSASTPIERRLARRQIDAALLAARSPLSGEDRSDG